MTDKTLLGASALLQIDKLEAPSGFTKWDRDIRDYLGMYGYQSLLTRNKESPILTPGADPAAHAQKLEVWEDKQERACAIIRSRCGFNAREEIKDQSTVDNALAKLKARFQPKGSAVFQQLMANYTDLTLEKCKCISQFAEKLREARNEIQELDATCTISEPQFVHQFLTGLSFSYAVFLTSFYQTNHLIPQRSVDGVIVKAAVTFDDAVIAAEKEEQAQQFAERAERANQNTALISYARSPARQCSHCHKTGHTHKDCWTLHPDQKQSFDERRRQQRKKRDEIKHGKTDQGDENPMPVTNMAWCPTTEMNVILMATRDTTTQGTSLLQDNWLLDSGCNNHASCRKEAFLPDTLKPYAGLPVNGFGGVIQTPELIGTIRIPCDVGGKLAYLYLRNTFYHPSAGCNIISAAQLRQTGADLAFCKEGISISTKKATFIADEKYGLYLMRLWKGKLAPAPIATPAYAISDAWLAPWHERLGHLGEQNLKRLQSMSTGMRPLPNTCTCMPCVNAKLRENPHDHSFKRGEYPLEFIHIDLSGRMPRGIHGEEYWVTIVDDTTALTDVTPVVRKNDLPRAVQRFLEKYERPERRCHRARIDQGGENLSPELTEYLKDRGVLIEPTGTEQHQANGVAEATQRLILERTHATLETSRLDLKFWPYIAEAVGYLRLFSPHNRLDMTPYQAWYGDKPDLSHIRTLGCSCIAYKTGHRKKLQESKGVPCRLLGYQGSKTYKLLKDNGEVVLSSNVVFQEKRSCLREFQNQNNSHLPPPLPASPLDVRREQKDSNLPPSHPADSRSEVSRERQKKDSGPPPLPPANPLRNQKAHAPIQLPTWPRQPDVSRGRGKKDGNSLTMDSELSSPIRPSSASNATPALDLDEQPPIWSPSPAIKAAQYHSYADPALSDSNNDESMPTQQPELRVSSRATKGQYSIQNAQRYNFVFALIGMALLSTELCEPKNLQQAKVSTTWAKWVDAMKIELESIHSNKTWTLVPRPGNRRVLGGKWVYKLKRGPNGEILRHKARWVVRGFEQEYGIDYNETFASVVKPMSYKALFAITAALDLEIHQMDVKTAFLYGNIDEEIYVEQPHELNDGTDRVCRLNKALYGLKQSPRIWYNTLAAFLMELGFSPLAADLGVFSKGNVYIAIYVDDILIAGPDLDEINQLKAWLTKRFEMTDLGEISFYLGMEIKRHRPTKTLRLSQRAYLAKILDNLKMQDCKPVATPMDLSKLTPAEKEYASSEADRQWYAGAIGSLMYLMLGTRPDIAFAVSCLSRFMSNPTSAHITAVKRVCRYLKGTQDLELVFRGDLCPLSGYTDADWAGDTATRRSTSGYIFNLGSGAISWSSKRQPVVALSSCESEYMGETQATKEAIWLRRLLAGLLGHEEPMATVIFGDNQGAIALAKNPQFHARTKHIDIQHHFVREKQAEGEVDVQYTPTERQIADGLTKALPKDVFEAFRKALGLERVRA